MTTEGFTTLVSDHPHHWVIDSDGLGVCKVCNGVKMFSMKWREPEYSWGNGYQRDSAAAKRFRQKREAPGSLRGQSSD